MTTLQTERIAALCEQLKLARLSAEWPALAQDAARTSTTSSQKSNITRMDEIEVGGTYDRDADGLRRSRQGMVGDDMMTCQVAVMDSNTLIAFWSVTADGH